MGPDWDGYGGRAIDFNTIYSTFELLKLVMKDETPVPSIVPTSIGGIQIEWHVHGIDLEVEFITPVRLEGLFEDSVTGVEWEKDLTLNLNPLVEAISILTNRQRQ